MKQIEFIMILNQERTNSDHLPVVKTRVLSQMKRVAHPQKNKSSRKVKAIESSDEQTDDSIGYYKWKRKAYFSISHHSHRLLRNQEDRRLSARKLLIDTRSRLVPANVLMSIVLVLIVKLYCDNNLANAAAIGVDHSNESGSATQAANSVTDRQSFRKEPDKEANLFEGDTILLGCEVNNQVGAAQWLKDGVPIFHSNGQRFKGSSERHVLVGDLARGDHSLELRGVQLEDSGSYECQVLPESDESPNEELRAASRITVRPQPPPTSVLASGGHFAPSELASPHLTLATKESHLQTRYIAIGSKSPHGAATANSIMSNQLNSPAATLQLTPHASASPSLQLAPNSLHSLSSSSPSAASSSFTVMMVSWPYMLLMLAALLMVANVYLIYSLIKQHLKRTSSNSHPRA